jgi:putative SOS response-associated peptidase YedK
MTYVLEATHTTLEHTFAAPKTFGFYQPRDLVQPGDYAPIVRTSSTPLLSRLELSLLRYGLVPPGFSSARESDQYGMHQVRAKRVGWQREVARLYSSGNRCLVPMTGSTGEITAAAGLWGRWTRVRRGREERLESYAVFTVPTAQDTWVPLVLEPWDWTAWLEDGLDLDVLRVMPAASFVG